MTKAAIVFGSFGIAASYLLTAATAKCGTLDIVEDHSLLQSSASLTEELRNPIRLETVTDDPPSIAAPGIGTFSTDASVLSLGDSHLFATAEYSLNNEDGLLIFQGNSNYSGWLDRFRTTASFTSASILDISFEFSSNTAIELTYLLTKLTLDDESSSLTSVRLSTSDGTILFEDSVTGGSPGGRGQHSRHLEAGTYRLVATAQSDSGQLGNQLNFSGISPRVELEFSHHSIPEPSSLVVSGCAVLMALGQIFSGRAWEDRRLRDD